MEMKKEVREEENICTALLTAGVVLSMACLKHFSAVSSLIEQWRAWVFIVLNIVLLAIYFTSTSPDSRENQDFKIRRAARLKIMRRKRAKRVCPDFIEPIKLKEVKNCVVKEHVEEKKRVSVEMEDNEKVRLFGKKMVDDKERESIRNDNKEDEDYEPCRLSNEELNERVEAFITMFKQHLVLDGRRGRDRDRDRTKREVPRRSVAEETMNSQDIGYLNSNNINFSAREVTCSV